MIEREYSKYILSCDCCGKQYECDTWHEAVDTKKDLGWTSKKIKNEWFDICDECTWNEGEEFKYEGGI